MANHQTEVISNEESKARREILRKYYTDNDLLLSAEGILKVLSVIACIVSSVLFLSGGSCAGAPGLVTSATTVALVCAAAMALLYAGVVLSVPLYAPIAWLFSDLIVSSVLGVVLLVTAILNMTLCESNTPTEYALGPLVIVNAGMVMGSAVTTYVTVMKRWDTVQGPAREPVRLPPSELDV